LKFEFELKFTKFGGYINIWILDGMYYPQRFQDESGQQVYRIRISEAGPHHIGQIIDANNLFTRSILVASNHKCTMPPSQKWSPLGQPQPTTSKRNIAVSHVTGPSWLIFLLRSEGRSKDQAIWGRRARRQPQLKQRDRRRREDEMSLPLCLPCRFPISLRDLAWDFPLP
jgi:hypothetical protein